MINKTTEYWNYRQSLQTGLDRERGPRFIRRETANGKGADIVDISEAARKRLLERNNSPLVRSIMSFSRDLGDMVRDTEGESDAARSARVSELKGRVREGLYDFENPGRIESAADSLIARIKTRHNNPECA